MITKNANVNLKDELDLIFRNAFVTQIDRVFLFILVFCYSSGGFGGSFGARENLGAAGLSSFGLLEDFLDPRGLKMTEKQVN